MFKKLRNRILVLNMVITSIVMISAFSVVYVITAANIQTDNEHELMNIPSLAITLDENGEFLQRFSLIEIPESDYSASVQEAWESRENPGVVRVEFAGKTWLRSIAQAQTLIDFVTEGTSETPSESPSASYELTDITWQVSFLDITGTQKTLRDLLLTFLAVGVVMLAVIFLISRFFANRAMRPVVQAWNQQRRFVADASHELRTPLAIISANYDALLMNKEETVESQQEWLGYMKSGMDRMTKLTNDLLVLNTIEDGGATVQAALFDLSAAVQNVVASMEPLARERGIEPRLAIAPNVTLISDQALVEQLVSALYENALKYTEKGGTIELALVPSAGRVSCSVRNTGDGIPPEAIEHIFDRFYRVDASRNSETSGYGLGLSIAKTIAEKLGGTLIAKSTPNEWTSFTLTLKTPH
jgi:signal transduction histidine kinase